MKSGQQPPEGDGEGIVAARGERGEGDGGSGRLEPGRWAMVNASQKRSKAGDHSRGRQCDRGGRGKGRTTTSYPVYTRLVGQ